MVVMGLHGSQEAREKVILGVQGWVMLAQTRVTGGKRESGQLPSTFWR